MLTTSEYYAAVISDVHLCHDRTPTFKIAEEIKEAFPDNEETAKLNTIYIAGDWFDKLINYPNRDIDIAEDLMVYLLKLCLKRDIQLRVLEGTPSHDWTQPRRFLHLNKHIGADVLYFDTLEIEHNERYGIDVLYIPDEYNPDTNVTYIDVKKKMTSLGLDKVDLAIMHGQFNYQLPEVAKVPKHNECDYLNIVRYYIAIGHVHVHSTYERIIAQGSFSRLAHGEENPKGHVRFHLFADGNMKARFIENKLATKYITIDVRNMDLDKAITHIKKTCKQLPVGSFIRLRAIKGDPILIQQNLDLLSNTKLDMIWTRSVVEDEHTDNTVNDTNDTISDDYIPITLTKDNLTSCLVERLEKRGYDVTDIESVKLCMESILNDVNC
jgi:hypothetical protein